jgi:hypothetical protein
MSRLQSARQLYPTLAGGRGTAASHFGRLSAFGAGIRGEESFLGDSLVAATLDSVRQFSVNTAPLNQQAR